MSPSCTLKAGGPRGRPGLGIVGRRWDRQQCTGQPGTGIFDSPLITCPVSRSASLVCRRLTLWKASCQGWSRQQAQCPGGSQGWEGSYCAQVTLPHRHLPDPVGTLSMRDPLVPPSHFLPSLNCEDPQSTCATASTLSGAVEVAETPGTLAVAAGWSAHR